MNSDDIGRVSQAFLTYIGTINQPAAMRIKADKIIEAFKAAARKGIKNWRYIEVILEAPVKAADPDRFTQGKYGENVHSGADDILAAWNTRRQQRQGCENVQQ